MGYKGYVQWGTGVWSLWAMGYRGYGPHRQWVTWDTGVWGIWAMRPTGGIGYRGMGHMGNRGTWGMGYKGYGLCGQWDTWAMGYRGMSHMGKGGPWAICSQNIKKMSSCQKDIKCQKIKHLDYGGGSQKN